MNALESAYWAGARDAAAAIYTELGQNPAVGAIARGRTRDLLVALTVRGGVELHELLREEIGRRRR
jgi:hypothetical protein